MDKVVKNGLVAVLYSPGFGAGWSTWNDSEIAEALCMDARIVKPVLKGDLKKAEKIAKELFPGVYTGGAEDLEVEWVPEGAQFEIDEYDGKESVHVIGERRYLQA